MRSQARIGEAYTGAYLRNIVRYMTKTMRKRNKLCLRYLLFLCCIGLQSCLPPNPTDQKTGQRCVSFAGGSVECLPVDGHQLLLLHSGAGEPQVMTWDASASLDTTQLGTQTPSQALLQVLLKGDSAAQSYTLDPLRTSIRFQDDIVFLIDRQNQDVVQKIVLDANRAIAFAPAVNLPGTLDYIVYSEAGCKPMSLLDSLLRVAEGKYDVQLTHCGNSLYARMGHVIVAISEFKPILSKPRDCDTLHVQKGWIPAHDLAGALAALTMPPGGGAKGADAPVQEGLFLHGLPDAGLSIYLCGDRIKLVPADQDHSPYYLDPTRCCYVLRRNVALGLLEIWFSKDQSA